MSINVEEIIKRALDSWDYALSAAEHWVEEYKKERDYGELFLALMDANEVISNTSHGSIYSTLMETSGLESKYKGNFVKLWAKAKEIKFKALGEIDALIEDTKKNSRKK